MFFRNRKTLWAAVISVLVCALGGRGVIPAQAGAENLQAGTIYRVTTSGATSGSCGSTWLNSCDLQYALTIATSEAEIWVAAGTYYPDLGAGQIDNSRDSSFRLPNGVSVYGGFNGTEVLLTDRNPAMNVTTLSGDIGTPGIVMDNAYHVVMAESLFLPTRLDGFTLMNGYADGGNDFGGGMYISDSGSNVQLIDVVITDNYAGNGGGLAAFISGPTLTRVTLNNNTAERYGGGFYNQDGSPTLLDVIFDGNQTLDPASPGGGMHSTNTDSLIYTVAPSLTNVTFSDNMALQGGGGGLFNNQSHAILTNVTFSGNSASVRGGAVLNEGSNVVFNNVTFNDNTAPAGTGSAMRNIYSNGVVPSHPIIRNTILWGNGSEEIINDVGSSVTIDNSVVMGGCPALGTCTDITTADPKLGTLADNGGFTKTMSLGFGSSAIDTGDNLTCETTDQRDIARPWELICDMGAYETYSLIVTADSKTILYGSPEPIFTFQYTGMAGGDTESVIDTPPTCTVSGTHSNAGTYTIACSGGADKKYLFFGYVNGTLTINKATPTLSVTNSPVTYDGSTHAASVSGSVPGNATNIQADGSATQTNAGTYTVTANFTPTDTTNYNSLTNATAGTFTINKATPIISVSNSPVVYNGSPRSATVTSSASGTPSNILTGGSASQTDAGTYAVTANFTPADTDNYNSLTNASAGNFIINKATPVLSITNSPILYDGLSHSATVTSPVLGSVSNILTGGSASQTNAGTYPVTANFTPTDTANYNSLTNASVGNFIINKITPTLSVSNSPVLFDALPHAATIDSSVPGSITNILTGGSATQTSVGTYPVTANFTPFDAVNYNSLTNASAGNFVISPDLTPPDTQLNIRPVSPSAADVTFTFSSADVTAVFECQLDGGGFSACTSPKNYTGLANGSHTFSVRARDPADNIDATPVAFTWKVTTSTLKSAGSRIVVATTLLNQGGFTNGLTDSLGFFEQSGSDDNTGAYVTFQTPGVVYFGQQSFFIPEDIQTSLISNTLLQVNFNGPASSTQTWTWSIYDWKTNLWIKLGTTIGATADEWNSMTFPVRSLERYVSPRREVRIQLRSNNANGDLKVDYEALHLTYRSMTLPLAPSAPLVPLLRPGIASTSGKWMVR